MAESEAIKRINECRNTPGFQPYGYINEALNIAIKALEKQIAKKPIYDNYHRAGYRCPDCNNTNPWGYKHCKYCGQKLDWSGEK